MNNIKFVPEQFAGVGCKFLALVSDQLCWYTKTTDPIVE